MSVDKTAQRIINAFSNLPPHVGMVFEDGQSIDLVKLVPMVKLWLMRDEIRTELRNLKDLACAELGKDVSTAERLIEALEGNDE